MPVLPLVGSTTSVSLVMRPSFSAASIMDTPILSLTLPQGLKDSSLATTVAPNPSAILFSLTSGVFPMSCVMSSAIFPTAWLSFPSALVSPCRALGPDALLSADHRLLAACLLELDSGHPSVEDRAGDLDHLPRLVRRRP